MGHLQLYGMDYADFLMQNYNNADCAYSIEEWRNRITKPYDRDKVMMRYPNLSARQRKQVVEYAKRYILRLINNYLAP